MPSGEDESAFGASAEPHRSALLVHCYRMLGNLHDAEDVTQETLLRAWRTRARFEGNASMHTWLHRIATNACLDVLRRRHRRPVILDAVTHPATAGAASPVAAPWLQPIPDRLLDSAAASLEDVVVARETVELAMIAAIQYLPPRQRAVFALRDVLGWSAQDTAAALETTVAGVNSALQRARSTIREQLPNERSQWSTRADVSPAEREVAARFMAAIEAGDDAAIRRLLHPLARVGHAPGAGGNVTDEPAVYAVRRSFLAPGRRRRCGPPLQRSRPTPIRWTTSRRMSPMPRRSRPCSRTWYGVGAALTS
jgi:RNA polymerase sigma-70 factor, ECF subfamily